MYCSLISRQLLCSTWGMYWDKPEATDVVCTEHSDHSMVWGNAVMIVNPPSLPTKLNMADHVV